MAKKKAKAKTACKTLENLEVVLTKHTYEMIHALIVAELMVTLDNLKHDLKTRREGGYKSGVFSGDKQEDLLIIQEHIDSMKLIILYFGGEA